ncbi:MAG: DNA-processing protein DprA [Prevotella sp.]|nr:DNA-processing protein DprA [Prevotella sp.]
MSDDEVFYAMALSRMTGFNSQTALHLYHELGSASRVYAERTRIADAVDGCSPRLVESMQDWDEALMRAEAEMDYISRHGIKVLTPAAEEYPARLRETPDAPLVVYYLGTADLNQQYVVAIVGTRRCTTYGQDLTRRFIAELKEMCPQVLIVSGLAYGIDICAHHNALERGYETVGVMAHGLDTIYPRSHRDTAAKMVGHGGLLTEYMSASTVDKSNFVRRNRIVAGMSDATIVVESAAKGGGLITASIAQSYDRAVFAFPGAVGAKASEGCNNLIRDNGAALISTATDFVQAMGWQTLAELQHAKATGIERTLFPDLTAEERLIVDALTAVNDQQLNTLSVKTNTPIGQLTALLFQLEMKGVVKALAGGTYHLMN